jgi:hypothetical protein
MSDVNNDEKLAQFNEFFSIDYRFSINATRLATEKNINFEQFLDLMPMPFKMASEVNTLDHNALRPLQAVAGVAGQLVEYLNHQAQKIDLLVGYILSQQDSAAERYQAIKFGGGGIIFQSEMDKEFTQGDFIELKLFFPQENSAVFCIGEIVREELVEQQQHYTVIYHHIREEDRELLVRNSLHQQSKQLQALSQQRNQKRIAKD